VPTEGLGELVEARITEVTAGLLLVGIARPAAILADDREDRQLIADGRVELHGVHAERAVTVQHDHLLVGQRDLGADAEWHTDAHGTESARIYAMACRELRDRLPAVVRDLLP